MKVLRVCLGGLVLAWLAASSVSAAQAPFHFKIYRPGLPTIEIMVEAGESAELRNQSSGEVLELLPRTAEGRVLIDIFRSNADRRKVETVEVEAGAKASTRKLETPLEIELLSAPQDDGATASQSAAGLFEVKVKLPSGRTVVAVADIASGELVRLASPELPAALGFRAAITRPTGRPRVEVFTVAKNAGAQEIYRFVKSLPLGGVATVGATEFPGTAELAGVVEVQVEAADPEEYGNTAMAGGLDSIVELQVRFEGGRWMGGAAYGGEMLRVEHPSFRGQVGFAPVEADGEAVTFNVFRVRYVHGAGEGLELLETVTVRPGAPTLVASLGSLAEVQLLSSRPPLVRGRCWLGCGAGSGHGCSVSCGDEVCCTGACCRY